MPTPKNSYATWTAEQERRLVYLFELGASPQGMAEDLNRSPASIVSRLVKLNLAVNDHGHLYRKTHWKNRGEW